jgi:hypothetical protein
VIVPLPRTRSIVARIVACALPAVLLASSSATPASASDQSTLKALVITKADVGSGYTSKPGTDEPDVFPQMATCVGKALTDRVRTANVEGPRFTRKSDGSSIDSSVEFVKTAAMVQTDIALVQDPKFPGCLASVNQAQGASDGITKVTTQAASVKSYGDFSTAFVSLVTGTLSQGPFSASVATVYIARGRVEFSANFTTLVAGTQPPPSFSQATAQKILDKVNARLKKAKVS